MSKLLTAQQDVITELILDNKKLKQELDEAQLCLKKAITELDLAGVEIFKWERDFMTVVNDFKAVVKQLKKTVLTD